MEEERRAGLGGGVAERPQRGVPALLRGLVRAKEQKRRKKRSESGRERERWRVERSPLFPRLRPTAFPRATSKSRSACTAKTEATSCASTRTDEWTAFARKTTLTVRLLFFFLSKNDTGMKERD